MAGFSHDDLIAALENKLDYRSARTVAGFALANAAMEQKAKYAGAEADALLAALQGEIGDRAQSIKDRLASAPAAAKEAPKAKAPAAKAPAAKEAAAKEAPKAKAKPAAADAKKAPAKKAPASKPAAKKS